MNDTFEIFLRNVDVKGPDECWEWKLARDGRGYGMTYMPDKTHSRSHRVSYQLDHGVRLDKDTVVRHRCDNPPCCNPSHLVIGSQADNMKDMKDGGRSAFGKKHRAYSKPSSTKRGEDHYNAKLDETKVKVIRYINAVCGIGATSISKLFNIAPSTIQHVIDRDSWKEVSDLGWQ